MIQLSDVAENVLVALLNEVTYTKRENFQPGVVTLKFNVGSNYYTLDVLLFF